ncbi:DUF3667 domain-containing protein [Flavobacterium sp. Sd200]|uniref:DUF3667 domain-containing protein n=1 Tax=Flavobacterium sp. Sd200 TaxID=2692211 RepID=UPI00136C4CC7|nr:DUF3667 domain-containing protein [Flavobacterium sp. Sd200]MXN92657.1 DUF3667 domain-containing protein [Flavobacterium sp. Sd200]
MEVNCQNCGYAVTGNYCADCGHSQELKRIDKNYAFEEFLNIVGFEKGFIFTCKELLINPGATIREYINKNRQRVTKPITFLFLTSVIYTLISQYFKTENPYADMAQAVYGDSSLNSIMNWVQDNYGYANLLMILPITLWAKLFFKRYKYNFYETFVVISFVMAFGMLLFSVEPVLNRFFTDTFMLNETITICLVMLYVSWAIGQFYERKLSNYVKGFCAYFFGFLTFQIVMVLIGITYDVVVGR